MTGLREDAFHTTDAETQKRIELAACTSHRAWEDRHRGFSQLLNRPGKTLAETLSETYTFYEACLLAASSRPELQKLQTDCTRRHGVPLRERFRGAKEELATELAMAYFGLPVGPLSAPGDEADDKMDVDIEQRGELEGEHPSDTHTAPPADQTALHLRGGGPDSDSEQDTDDEYGSQYDDTHGDETQYDETQYDDSDEASSRGGDKWVLLHGFQGAVPFLVSDVDTFESAVETLLSLPPGSAAPYVLVHFNAREGKLVEITDELGSGAEGRAAGYVAQHWGLDDEDDDDEEEEEVPEHPADCCALFVRLTGETTPAMWKPTEGQFKADVAQIKHTCMDINKPQSRGPASAAYISFPKTAGPDGPHVGLWDAGQYIPYIQTAVDVLLGRSGDDCPHHAVLQLAKASDDRVASYSRSYCVLPLRPGDLQAIHPRQRPEAVLLRQYPLLPGQMALVLPGFYPAPTAGVVGVVSAADLKPHRPGRLPNATQHMRRMVTQFLGGEAVGVPYVRLLAGDATLSPACVDRRQVTALIPMSDAVLDGGATPAVEVCRALTRFVDTAPRFIVLYPQYKQGEVHMHAGWPSDAPPEKRLRPLPPLASTADDFRAAVAELSRAVGGGAGAGGVVYEPRVHQVSIRALLSHTGAQIEASTFFVGPRTTDDEWFSIRAQLATRNAEVNVWPPAKWEWRGQIARSNVWGPRYGRAADGHARAIQGRAAGHGVVATVPSGVPVKKPAPVPAHHHASPEHRDAAPERRRGPPPPSKSKAIVEPPAHPQPGTPVTACPHAGCGFTFRGAEKAAFERHVRERHVAHKCLWCEEPLPEWWTDEAKDAHLRGRHRDKLMQALGVRRATINQRDGSSTVSIALKRGQGPAASAWATNRYSAPPVDVRRPGAEDDGIWRASSNPLPLYGAGQKFCDRCGRDRRQFFSEAEQAYHDRHCTPGVYPGARCTFCTECGDYRWGSALDAARSGRCGDGVATPCGHATGAEAGQFCRRCGLDGHALLPGGREVHEACCRGYGAQPGRFCPHCGVRFWEGHAQADWYHNTRHIETCEARDAVMKQPDIAFQEGSREDGQPRRVLSEPPGRIPGPKQPGSKKKQTPKPKYRHYHYPDDGPLPSVEDDDARRRGGKRRRRRPDDSDYEYNSDVDSADSLRPDDSDVSDGDPEAARRRKRRRMLELDPAYQYETDEDSADGLQPDVDDLAAVEDGEVDAEAEAEAQAQGLAVDKELERDKAEAEAAAAAAAPKEHAQDAAHQPGHPLKPPVPPRDAAPAAAPSPSPPATKGKKGRRPAKKASPKKARPGPAPGKATAPKPRQPKETPGAPPRRSARLGSRKP